MKVGFTWTLPQTEDFSLQNTCGSVGNTYGSRVTLQNYSIAMQYKSITIIGIPKNVLEYSNL